VYGTLRVNCGRKLSNDDITSGSRRPQAAEIDKPPLKTNDERQITSERYTMDTKHVLDTIIGNRGHIIDWRRHFRSLTPLSGRN
jgi:hypothetical protein